MNKIEILYRTDWLISLTLLVKAPSPYFYTIYNVTLCRISIKINVSRAIGIRNKACILHMIKQEMYIEI